MERLKIDYILDNDEEILKEMKQAYLDCAPAVKYCKELGISDQEIDDNITKVFDFVTDINYCKKCPGLKKCDKPNAMLNSKIVYNYGMVDIQLSPCKELMKRVTFEKQFKVMDFEESLLDVTLKEINQNAGRKKALLKYNQFIKIGLNEWIYLTGAHNSGRSYFASVLSVDAAKRMKGPIYFLNSLKRIQELYDMSKNSNKEFIEQIDKLSNAPILVLDDFGNEYKNDYIRDAIIFPIISNRANKKLFTIITSDFTLQEIATLYSTTKAGSIRANQIYKIMLAACKEEINLGMIEVY